MKKSSHVNIFILVLLTVSLIFNVYFVLNSMKLNEKIVELENKSNLLSAKTVEYLELNNQCDVNTTDVEVVINCLKNLIEQYTSKPTMRGSSFSNAPPLTNTQGYQILVYEGVEGRLLDSEGFKLYINHNLEDDDGCEERGKIEPGYTCKLTFNHACYSGDVMVVKYYDEEVFRTIC